MGATQQVMLAQQIAGGGGNPISVTNAWIAKAASFSASQSITVSGIVSGRSLVLIAQQENDGGAISSVTDNKSGGSGTWTQIGSTVATGTNQLSMWFCANADSSVTSITVNLASPDNFGVVIVHEFSGSTGSFTPGEVATATDFNSSLAIGPVTNATSNSIFFVVGVMQNGSAGNTAPTASAGWTLYDATNSKCDQSAGSNGVSAAVYYQLVTSSAAKSNTFTFGTTAWNAGVEAAFH